MASKDRSRRRAQTTAVTAIVSLALPVALAFPGAALASAAPATSPNAVIVWDMNAQIAIWDIAGQQPANISGRSWAMVSGAVYDAVNAIAGAPYEPYLVAPPANGAESVDAAVATAAHGVLASLFPEQDGRLRGQYEEYLTGIPDGRAKADGVTVGAQAAAAMIEAREDDGAFGDQLWPEGDEPGHWRPDPPNFGNSGGWVADMTPFLIPEASVFRTDGPPELGSRAYARDVNEIKRLGSATSRARTAAQTETARWWHDRRYVHWEIKRQLASTQGLSVLETARLFAMIDLIGADTSIACAEDKRFWSFWRPIAAVRLADTDGNPRTKADPDWEPLLTTPPVPDYPSGATCGNGTRMAVYEAYFGTDDVAYSAYSVDTGTRRYFDSFSESTAEVIEARIWGGIHFRTADVNGVELGERVAAYVLENHFRPQGDAAA